MTPASGRGQGGRRADTCWQSRRVDGRNRLNGCLRVQPQHKLVTLRVDHILADVEARQLKDGAHQRHVAVTKLELDAALHVPDDVLLADERPRVGRPPTPGSPIRSPRYDCALVQVLSDKGSGGQVVGDARGQVIEDTVDRVPGLLTRYPQVLLQGTSHGRENGLRCLQRIH